MKRILILAAAFMLTVSAFAQSPEKMSYQAVVRNSTDNLVASQTIGMQISILQGSTSGTAVYEETQTPTTNANGLVSLEIGNGTVVSGDFSTIDWANGPYFIKTETDPDGGTTYTITGTSQLMSVPFALHAKTAESVTGGIAETDPDFNAWDKSTGILISESQITDLVDTDTQIDSAGIAALGFVAGPHTVNTDTQLDETAVDGFVANNGYLTSFTEVDGSITNEIELPTTADAGDMVYWNGTAWVVIPTTVNEGATLQMIGGIPTWTGGTEPISVGSQVEGGIVYKIFEPGDAGYVVGETHGMVASATQGQSNYFGAQAFVNTLNTGTYSNWTLPDWADQGPIRTNLLAAGADLNFIDNADHWAGNVVGGANWVFNIHFGSGYSAAPGTIHSVFAIREF